MVNRSMAPKQPYPSPCNQQILPYGKKGLCRDIIKLKGFPGGSDGKESTCKAGDPNSIPGSGRPLGEENGYPLQYSCLENSMDKRVWWATVHGVAKSRT